MLDVTVKTLDGKNRAFSVPDEMSIKDFKRTIAESIDISPDTQRLIFQGRVLQDDKKMIDYDINGKTLHAVQRPPPLADQSASGGASATTPSSTDSSQTGGTSISMDATTTSVLVRSFTMPSDMVNTTNVQLDGSTMDVRINLDPANRHPIPSESQSRISQARRMLRAANRIINRLDNLDVSPQSPRSEPTPSPATANASPSNETPASNASPANGTTTTTTQGERNATPEQRTRIPDPAPPVLGELLQEIFALNTRFQPHLEEYQRILREDANFGTDTRSARRSQRHADYVADVLHLISHAYHNVSDIMLDTRQAPPRRLHANPSQHLHFHSQPTIIAAQATPVQTHINVSHIVPRPQATPTTGATTPGTTATSTAPPDDTGAASGINSSASNNTTSGAATPINALPNMVAAQLVGLLNLNQSPASTATPGAQTTTQSGGTMPTPPPQLGPVPPPQFMPQFMPPELLQNMMQAAAANMPNIQIQQGPNRAVFVTRAPVLSTAAHPMPVFSVSPNSGPPASTPPSNNPPASASSTGPATTGEATTSQATPTTTATGQRESGGSGARPHLPAGARMVRRVPIDPYLPCQSRFFIGRANAAAHQQQQQQQQPIEDALRQRIASALESVVPNNPQPGGGANATNNASTVMTGSSDVSSQFPESPSFMEQVQSMLQQGQSSEHAAQSGEVFAELVQGIGSYLSQAAEGDQPTDTIADFMRQLGEHYNIEQSEGLLGDLCSCLSRQLTFVDLMAVIFGNPAPLRGACTALREFVIASVLDGAQPTDTVVQESLDSLFADMQGDIDAVCAEVQARDEIDFHATLSALMRHRLSAIVRLILNTPEGVTFEIELLQQVRLLLHEFVVLGETCLTGGMDDTIRMVQNRVRAFAGDVNPFIMQWMITMSSQQIRSLIPSSMASADSVAHYVVRRQPIACGRSSPPSSDGSFMSVDDNNEMVVDGVDTDTQTKSEATAQVMQVDEMKTATTTTTPNNPVVPEEDPVHQIHPVIPADVASRLAPAPLAATSSDVAEGGDDNVMVIVGSDEWHHPLPPEWVPIIARDVQRQANQPPQPAFSDAYVSGMPAKRRKLETTEKKSEEGQTKPVV